MMKESQKFPGPEYWFSQSSWTGPRNYLFLFYCRNRSLFCGECPGAAARRSQACHRDEMPFSWRSVKDWLCWKTDMYRDVHCTVLWRDFTKVVFNRATDTNMSWPGIEPGSPALQLAGVHSSKELFEQHNTIAIRNFYIGTGRPGPLQYLNYCTSKPVSNILIPMDMVL